MATLQQVIENRQKWGFVVKSQDEEKTVLELVKPFDVKAGQHFDSISRLEIADGKVEHFKNTIWDGEPVCIMSADLSEISIGQLPLPKGRGL